jgi:hypothetical protein
VCESVANTAVLIRTSYPPKILFSTTDNAPTPYHCVCRTPRGNETTPSAALAVPGRSRPRQPVSPAARVLGHAGSEPVPTMVISLATTSTPTSGSSRMRPSRVRAPTMSLTLRASRTVPPTRSPTPTRLRSKLVTSSARLPSGPRSRVQALRPPTRSVHRPRQRRSQRPSGSHPSALARRRQPAASESCPTSTARRTPRP